MTNLSPSLLKKAQKTELPLLALAAIRELKGELTELELAHIADARDRGASWEDIAEVVGVTRQALQQRVKAIMKTDQDEAIELDVREPAAT